MDDAVIKNISKNESKFRYDLVRPKYLFTVFPDQGSEYNFDNKYFTVVPSYQPEMTDFVGLLMSKNFYNGIIESNILPDDNDNGFTRRIIVIPFTNRVSGEINTKSIKNDLIDLLKNTQQYLNNNN